MSEPKERQAWEWERQPGEPSRPYSCFCIWRDMGAQRTFLDAVGIYLTVPPEHPKRSTSRTRQQQKYLDHPNPISYQKSLASVWARLGKRWNWQARADAYDARQEALRAERYGREQEEAEKARAKALSDWRDRQLQTYMGAQEAAVQGVRRLLELAQQGLLRDMPWRTRKHKQTTRELDAEGKPTGAFVTVEWSDPGLAETLGLIRWALIEGRKLENEHRGEAPPPARLELSTPTGRPLQVQNVADLTDDQLLDLLLTAAGVNREGVLGRGGAGEPSAPPALPE